MKFSLFKTLTILSLGTTMNVACGSEGADPSSNDKGDDADTSGDGDGGNGNGSGNSPGDGDGDGDGPGDGDGDGDGTPGEPAFVVIDDFEDGDVAIIEQGGRVGSWYTYSENDPRPLAQDPTAAADGLAIHAQGTHKDGVSEDQAYGGIGVDLDNENVDMQQPASSSRKPYDASDWDGVVFDIKSDGATKSIRFEVVTQAIASNGGGTCSGDGCFDSYGRDIVLSSEWQTVKVPFATLVQEGWGQQKPFEVTTLLGFAWEDLSTQPWDFWLDNLKFYKEAPDSGGGEVVTPTSCGDAWGEESNGSITWYTFDQGTNSIGDVNCSYGITTGSSGNGDKVNNVHTGSGTYFGAINTVDYDQAATCGACVEVTREGGASVVVTIVDQCPVDTNNKCVKGHIDLSKAAFTQLGTESEGYIGERAGNGKISWKYVSCPTSGNVKFRLKEPSNSNWNMVLVENHPYPIESVKVWLDGGWQNASRENFNYWIAPGGRMGTPPYRVQATDINGTELEAELTLTGGSQDSGEEFSCQ